MAEESGNSYDVLAFVFHQLGSSQTGQDQSDRRP